MIIPAQATNVIYQQLLKLCRIASAIMEFARVRHVFVLIQLLAAEVILHARHAAQAICVKAIHAFLLLPALARHIVIYSKTLEAPHLALEAAIGGISTLL